MLNYYNAVESKGVIVNVDQWCMDTYDYFQSMGIMRVEDLNWANNIVLEGSQGILLDQTCGIMPYCTPSNTTCKNIPEIVGSRWIKPVYVTRPYITRHGAGPIPSTKEVISVDDPNNQYNDFQKTMRAVKFDLELLKHSMCINSFSYPNLLEPQVVVTHIDEYPEFRIKDVNAKIRYFNYEKEEISSDETE